MVFVDVLWSDEFHAGCGLRRNSVVVLCDVFRASTTIPVALFCGAKKIIVSKDVKASLAMKSSDARVILAGERSGVVCPGFDVGNSPYMLRAMLSESANKGKAVVLNTTNFGRVLEDSLGLADGDVVVASLVNRKVVFDYLLPRVPNVDAIYFVAVGTLFMHGEKFEPPLRSVEDLFGVLSLVKLMVDGGCGLELSERASGYLREHAASLASGDVLCKVLWGVDYAKYLLELDKAFGTSINHDDLGVCIAFDTHPVVPLVKKTDGFVECYVHK